MKNENTNSVKEALKELNVDIKEQITEEQYLAVKLFKDKLHSLMDKNGYKTQADVYNKDVCTITKPEFSHLYSYKLIYANYRYPNAKSLIALSNTFNVPIDALLGRSSRTEAKDDKIYINEITKRQFIDVLIDLLRTDCIKISSHKEEYQYFDEISGYTRVGSKDFACVVFNDESIQDILTDLGKNYDVYNKLWKRDAVMEGIKEDLLSRLDDYPFWEFLPFV